MRKKTGAKKPDAAAPGLILAIAASAASVQSLARVLPALPFAEGLAAVIVLQQREALDDDVLKEALAATGRALTRVTDGQRLAAGAIYLPAPNVIVTLERGVFHTRPAQQAPGERGTIDSFLVSLAEDQQERSLALLFAGTGSDGALGVTAIKEAGGITLSERPDDVANLSASNSPAALVDFILPLDEIAPRVGAYLAALTRRAGGQDLTPDSPGVATALANIATILRNRTGHDFHGYKHNTFLRRVQRRMQVAQVDDLDSYIGVLRGSAEEPSQLFQDLLIGVTQFFRDAREFQVLQKDVVPSLFEGKAAADHVRCWVLGCATGEEAYSIAILLKEHAATLDSVPQIQIFATDIDGRALAAARAGRFPMAIEKDVSRERLARWFVKEGDTYIVVKELREMVIFSQHNVLKDAPFSRLDLISCRNLLIYLNADLQTRVIPLFHFALRAGGYLFLGNSENVSRHTKLFTPIEPRSRIFRRIETENRVLPDFLFNAVERRAGGDPVPLSRTLPEASLARRAERIAERYAPAYVVTDEQFDVLHFSGRTGRYIDPAGGAASLNLLNLLHHDLRPALRATLIRAAELNQPVQANRLEMGVNGDRLLVDAVVEPIQESSNAPRNFVVVFKEGPLTPEAPDRNGDPANEHVQRLDAELKITRDRLQATIEELESTNEELKSSNEEYQSLNEELQSANEELETSKEELQSVNEELTTVNGELAHRVHQLGRSNSDLKNLLESTQIATIFLDNDLKVMNYTPATADIVPLVETDIGRPIGHMKFRVVYDDLQDDVRRVLRTLGSIEREVENPASGSRYMARVLPYRSIENFIAGAVVTFSDITPVTRAERALRDSEAHLRFLLRAGAILTGSFDIENALRQIAELSVGHLGDFCVIDLAIAPDTVRRVAWAHKNSAEATRLATLARNLPAVSTQPHAPERLIGMAEPVLAPNVDAYWLQRADMAAPHLAFLRQVRFHSLLAVPLKGQERTLGAMTFCFTDDTPRHHNESDLDTAMELGRRAGVAVEHAGQHETLRRTTEQQKILLAELQHRVRNTLSVVRSIARRTAESSQTVDDFAAHFDGRLNAFARTQSALTRDPHIGIDLAYLLGEELLGYAAEEGKQVMLSGPPVRLQPKAAETFGLAVHELATNAVKYGALAVPEGKIQVSWRLEDGNPDPRLIFDWREQGVKLDGPPRRRGFGTELLERTLNYELGSDTSLRYESNGVHCIIRLPLTSHVIAPPPQK